MQLSEHCCRANFFKVTNFDCYIELTLTVSQETDRIRRVVDLSTFITFEEKLFIF